MIERLSGEQALERVQRALGPQGAEARLNFGQVDLSCLRSDLVDVVTKLRDGEGLQFRFFTFLSGVDWTEFGDEEEGGGGRNDFEVLIHLYSPDHAVHVNVHVPLKKEDLTCPSITGVFGGAQWHERECHEMFGIYFEGHPALAPLYLPEDFEGYPLRKSFKLPGRIVKDWPGAKDPGEAAAGGR